jgi:hypothetical protein
MQELRRRIAREEFDYQALMAALSDYANPWDKITSLLRRGDIIRVKKGLYVFGDELSSRPYSRHVLANLAYGPSFVSLESALEHHGLIPERVAAMTSVTPKRPKSFETPIGRFIYRQTPGASFHVGMDRVETSEVAFLIATPERALADTVRDDRGRPMRSQRDAARYLFDDLRIDESGFRQLHPAQLEELAAALRSRKIAACARLLRNLKESP